MTGVRTTTSFSGNSAAQPSEVLEDLPVRDPGHPFVLLRIDALEVEEDAIGQWRDIPQGLPVAEPRRFDGGVDATASRRRQKSPHKRALRQRLAAAEREPAPRPRVKRVVFFDDSYHLVHAHPVAGYLQGLRRADVGAVTAAVTAIPVDAKLAALRLGRSPSPGRPQCTDRSPRSPCSDRALRVSSRTARLALGIGAPDAGERTALEKNDRPNAGAVVQGELLDVEDQPFRFASRCSSGVMACPLKLMLRSPNDLVLKSRRQVDEVGAVPRDADQQVPVPLGIGLRRKQRVAVDDVELNVPHLHVASGADQGHQLPGSRLSHQATPARASC